MDAFRELVPRVHKVPDKLERAAVVDDLAAYLGVEPSLVRDQFKRFNGARTQSAPVAKRAELPPTERMLLLAMLTSERVREEILPQVSSDMTEGFASHEIFDAFRHATASDPARLFSEIEGRLSDPSKVLLHDVVAADQTSEEQEEELAWGQAQACLLRLQTDGLKRKISGLKAEIKIAMREGRVQEALALNATLLQLERAERPGMSREA